MNSKRLSQPKRSRELGKATSDYYQYLRKAFGLEKADKIWSLRRSQYFALQRNRP